jgi:hypothetical protein
VSLADLRQAPLGGGMDRVALGPRVPGVHVGGRHIGKGIGL